MHSSAIVSFFSFLIEINPPLVQLIVTYKIVDNAKQINVIQRFQYGNSATNPF